MLNLSTCSAWNSTNLNQSIAENYYIDQGRETRYATYQAVGFSRAQDYVSSDYEDGCFQWSTLLVRCCYYLSGFMIALDSSLVHAS